MFFPNTSSIHSFVHPLLLLALILGTHSQGKTQDDWCGTDERMEESMEEFGEARWYQKFHDIASHGTQRAGARDTIPVVIHVIHDGGPENISYEQIKDGIRVMNEDFNRENEDSTDTRPVFDSLAANSEIYFRLARYGPDSNCTNGITRTRSELTHNADDRVKDLVRWPTDHYLNFWLAKDLGDSGNGTLLGYAQFPFQGIDEDYGIVMRSDRFGTIGNSSSDGRTATHEVGHCLGLFHTFQGNGCGGNCDNTGDRLCDTPPAAQNTFSCDLGQNSCSTDTVGPSPYNSDVNDQIENFMSYDACQNMFSKDQKSVMKGAIGSIAGLQELTSSANLKATGVRKDPLCEAAFFPHQRVICEGESVRFTGRSYHGVQERTWLFPGGQPFFSLNDREPSISYPNAGSYDVELEVRQGNDTLSVLKPDAIKVLETPGVPTPFMENMEEDPIGSTRIIPKRNGSGTYWTLQDRTGASGHSSLVLENYLAKSGETYDVETRTIDASADSTLALSFKVAYRQKDPSDDETLEVYASQDCGNTWELRGTFGSDSLNNGAPKNDYYKAEGNTEWKRFSIVQPLAFGFDVENLRFRFRFISDGGNNIYLDDINVSSATELSLEEEGEEIPRIELYPNPASETVRIISQGRRTISYELKDASGRKLRRGVLEKPGKGREHRLSIRELPAGLYFLHFQSQDGGSKVKKLVVR